MKGGGDEAAGAAGGSSKDEAAWKERAVRKWEKEVEACAYLLCGGVPPVLEWGELEQAMEEVQKSSMRSPTSVLDEEGLPLYSRCAAGIVKLLRGRGLLEEGEVLEKVVGPHESSSEPKFAPRASVRVRSDYGRRCQWPYPYHTLAGFLFGAEGKVQSFKGLEANTAAMAFGARGATQPVYVVSFPLDSLLTAPETVAAVRGMTVDVEVVEAWLEAVDPVQRIFEAWPKDAKRERMRQFRSEFEHAYLYGHPPAPGQDLSSNAVALLVEKNLVAAKDISETVSEREKVLLDYQASFSKKAFFVKKSPPSSSS
ncbi:nitrile hydratase beta subunit domain-containing protein [Chloropicon primus]|uniref:Uncharacterized protein n=2 Tax=Chloropicon primus TaxID=1764295 RepID=A0A5B8MF33_9CHLO|nr:hypothetical protein A3770_02p15350 [Chloropicon primus]UPQ98226.1 nitrile hydratase beta subunit domain-containing protein [Chloropicon primus]|eukprot:QDZ19017.1 hypothetical protein A3770_02p15350 [Chloropicon primus]